MLEEGIESEEDRAAAEAGGPGEAPEAADATEATAELTQPELARDAAPGTDDRGDRRREVRRRRLAGLSRRQSPHRHARSGQRGRPPVDRRDLHAARDALRAPALAAPARLAAGRAGDRGALHHRQPRRPRLSHVAARRDLAPERRARERGARSARRGAGVRPERRRRARPARVPLDPGAHARHRRSARAADPRRAARRADQARLPRRLARARRLDRGGRRRVGRDRPARAAPGPRVRRRGAGLHRSRHLRVPDRRRPPRRAQRRRAAAPADQLSSTARCSRRAIRRRRTPRSTSATRSGRRCG